MNVKDINVNFDFTTDTKGFWDGFWERNDGLGAGGLTLILKVKHLGYIVNSFGVNHYQMER